MLKDGGGLERKTGEGQERNKGRVGGVGAGGGAEG